MKDCSRGAKAVSSFPTGSRLAGLSCRVCARQQGVCWSRDQLEAV